MVSFHASPVRKWLGCRSAGSGSDARLQHQVTGLVGQRSALCDGVGVGNTLAQHTNVPLGHMSLTELRFGAEKRMQLGQAKERHARIHMMLEMIVHIVRRQKDSLQ